MSTNQREDLKNSGERRYEEDYEEDAVEAEEIARRLGDQLWADINKARATTQETSLSTLSTVPRTFPEATSENPNAACTHPLPTTKIEAALVTIRIIVGFAEKDDVVRSHLASTFLPDSGSQSVLDALKNALMCRTISTKLAKALSPVVAILAKSQSLFVGLRQPNSSSGRLENRKRKRENDEADIRVSKRPSTVNKDLLAQMTEAVRVITAALGSVPPSQQLDPATVSAIQLYLHQVFLFAVTSSAGGGPNVSMLQELGGLIQVIGVLSGIQIGPSLPPNPGAGPQPAAHNILPPIPAAGVWLPQSVSSPYGSLQPNDIGTAVYPCLVPGCRKVFSRLYSLRSHERVHAVHRPFRCEVCPASFARNHDLKRHTKVHDRKAWKCCACDKIFSRRDALKRHKNTFKTRGGKGEACVDADVQEVELGEEQGDDATREERRAKLWHGIGSSGMQYGGISGTTGFGSHVEDGEEGEVQIDVISRVQSSVMGLHSLLKTRVSNALSASTVEPSANSQIDAATGQATLASVIARAQQQSMPQNVAGQNVSKTTSLPAAAITTLSGALGSSAAEGHPQPSVAGGSVGEANTTLSLLGLSEEQTRLLEQAIAQAAAAAHAQAEAEAALEEEGEFDVDEDYGDDEGETVVTDTIETTK